MYQVFQKVNGEWVEAEPANVAWNVSIFESFEDAVAYAVYWAFPVGKDAAEDITKDLIAKGVFEDGKEVNLSDTPYCPIWMKVEKV